MCLACGTKKTSFLFVYPTHLVRLCPLQSGYLLFHLSPSGSGFTMPGLPHCMPNTDEEAQKQVLEAFGIHACLWQICVVHAILNGEDVITISPTGFRKSLTYWMPLLFIKHGITVVVTPLKLLGGQFVEMLEDNSISAVYIIASNATNELFEVILLG